MINNTSTYDVTFSRENASGFGVIFDKRAIKSRFSGETRLDEEIEYLIVSTGTVKKVKFKNVKKCWNPKNNLLLPLSKVITYYKSVTFLGDTPYAESSGKVLFYKGASCYFNNNNIGSIFKAAGYSSRQFCATRPVYLPDEGVFTNRSLCRVSDLTGKLFEGSAVYGYPGVAALEKEFKNHPNYVKFERKWIDRELMKKCYFCRNFKMIFDNRDYCDRCKSEWGDFSALSVPYNPNIDFDCIKKVAELFPFLDFSKQENYFSYYPTNKKKVPNPYKAKRLRVKIGKAIRKAFPDLDDKSLEKKVVKLQTLQAGEGLGKFEVVEGTDISKYYHEDNYSLLDGTLGDSCMRYDSCQEYFEIYEDNCKMLILKDKDGFIKGRALVWETEELEVPFMDRVYYTNEKVCRAFINYAERKKWAYKQRQNYNTPLGIILDGKAISKELTIKLNFKVEDYSYFPYFDTFCIARDEHTLDNNWWEDEECGEQFYGEEPKALLRSTEGLLDNF